MADKAALLNELYQAKLEDLKQIAITYNLPKNGSVEHLRARLIKDLILEDWDFSDSGIREIKNAELGEILGVFGIKKSGSIRVRRQRLWLHLNHDPKGLTVSKLEDMTKDQLHALCRSLSLPLSGNKNELMFRVAGVLSSEDKAWGTIKRSLKRGNRGNLPKIPTFSEDDFISPSNVVEEIDEPAAEYSQPVKPVPSMPPIVEQTPELEEALEDMFEIEPPSQKELDEIRTLLEEPFIADEVGVGATEELEYVAPVEPMHNEAFESRMAEIKAAARDFLVVGNISDREDVEAFIDSLGKHGFDVSSRENRNFIQNTLNEIAMQRSIEASSVQKSASSWRERENLRVFENVRQQLRDSVSSIVKETQGDVIKGRVKFEQKARDLGLDTLIPSISGRVHALYDLHLDISEAEALQDPSVARRQRLARVLQHGAVHLSMDEQTALNKLEKNLGGFEDLVEAVLDDGEAVFSAAKQALVIRFLENRGYAVNTLDVRPRILACAGIVGSELGYISPSEIPRLAPGVMVSDSQVDAIITELQDLVKEFKSPAKVKEEKAIESDERLSTIESAKSRLDRADDVLNRLNLR